MRRGYIRCLVAGLLGALTLVVASRVDALEATVVKLFSQGPWSAVSGLIGYRGRIWFVNSEKFVNHNSADLYSYDPHTGDRRYEQHLFSQDVGDPTHVGGLLFWPFEDSRFSAGRGEFALTDGREWRWSWLPRQQVFHVHASATLDERIYVATSAWRGGLQRSADLGRTWQVVYEHPTPDRRVSRFTTLAVLDGQLFAGLTSHSQRGPKLFRLRGDEVSAVPGWPQGQSTWAATPYRGWLYAVNHDGGHSAVQRTDGVRVERVTALEGYQVRAFAAQANRLWAIAAHEDGAVLLASADGIAWAINQRLPDVEPVAMVVHAGDVYVGGIGPGDHGSLWGPEIPAPAGTPEVPGRVPDLPVPSPGGNLERDLGALDEALSRTDDMARYRERLEQALMPIIARRSPRAGRALAGRLTRSYPQARIIRFAGRERMSLARSNRWHLLRAIALTGHGRIPTELLLARWSQGPNRAEKYLEIAPAAAWAAARIGQDDVATLDALIERLGAPDLPFWVNGDLVGALTALTAQRFAYDFDAWRVWWARERDARDSVHP